MDYHYASGADLGGGEYERPDRVDRPDAAFYRVGPGSRTADHGRVPGLAARPPRGRTGPDGIIEITHSGAYQEQLDFDLIPATGWSSARPRAPGR